MDVLPSGQIKVGTVLGRLWPSIFKTGPPDVPPSKVSSTRIRMSTFWRRGPNVVSVFSVFDRIRVSDWGLLFVGGWLAVVRGLWARRCLCCCCFPVCVWEYCCVGLNWVVVVVFKLINLYSLYRGNRVQFQRQSESNYKLPADICLFCCLSSFVNKTRTAQSCKKATTPLFTDSLELNFELLSQLLTWIHFTKVDNQYNRPLRPHKSPQPDTLPNSHPLTQPPVHQPTPQQLIR